MSSLTIQAAPELPQRGQQRPLRRRCRRSEKDDSVPLASMLDWARPRSHPVVVLPGASHLSTGKLPLLRDLILAHLQRPTPTPP